MTPYEIKQLQTIVVFLPLMTKTRITSDNFGAQATIKNGGNINLYRTSNAKYPRFVFKIQPNGQITELMLDEFNGYELDSKSVGRLPSNDTIMLKLDGCKTLVTIYDDNFETVGQINNSEHRLMNWIEATGDSNQKITLTLSASIVCGSSSSSPTLSSLSSSFQSVPKKVVIKQTNEDQVQWYI